MAATKDPDLLLIERMLAPPSSEDARNSLEYWQARLKRLPLYRPAARREAKEMAICWQERAVAQHGAEAEADSTRPLASPPHGIIELSVRRARKTPRSWSLRVAWDAVLQARKVKRRS